MASFSKMGGTVAQPKRAYAQILNPFGCVIGTGYCQ